MARDRIRVGLLFGGKSGEHEVSIQSARGIYDALDPDRYAVLPIGVERNGSWRLGASSEIFVDAEDVTRARIDTDAPVVLPVPGEGATALVALDTARTAGTVDVFFPILHGTFGEDGSIQGFLRMLDTPYVGPGLASSALAMDKDTSKRVLADAGLAVARQLMFRAEDERPAWLAVARFLGEDLFVKPANLGSSVGIRRARNAGELDSAVRDALQYDAKLVIEEAIDGREIECAVLGNERPECSLPGEVTPKHDFYSYEAKYVDPDGADLHVPADLDDATTRRAQSTAIGAYRALGCEGMARVDLFLRPDGELLVNEVNTLPGFTRISMYPKLWEVSGLPYPRLLDRLIELGLERRDREASLTRRFASGRA